MLFGHFWLPNDRLSPKKLLGLFTAFTGIFVTLAPNLQSDITTTYLIGDLIVLLTACFLGLRITLTKVFVQDIYSHRLLVWLLGLSIPCFLCLTYLFERGQPVAWTPLSCAGLFYQGWIITSFCFLVLTSVLRKYKASKLVVCSFLMPVSGVPI